MLLSVMDAQELTLQRAQLKIDIRSDEPVWTAAREALWRRVPLLSFQPGMTRQQFQSAVQPLVERVQARLQAIDGGGCGGSGGGDGGCGGCS